MEIVFVIVALLTGGGVAFIFMWYYHRQTNRRLRIEVDKLTDINFLILQRLEDAGLLKWSHDNQGNVIGLDLDFEEDPIPEEQEVKDKTIH